MWNVILMNKQELIVFLLAFLGLLVYYKRAGYSKKEMVMWGVIVIPFLYFSINMLTEAVTADEAAYEECITDIKNVKSHVAAYNVLYEYKFSQLTIGTVFWFLSDKVRAGLGYSKVWMIYKALHWFLMYAISLVTVNVWRKHIVSNFKNSINKRFAENSFLIMLMGFPLASLMMKVANYDAGSTYPAILGVVLLWTAFKENDKKIGFWATIVTALGVLDKWPACVYWIVAVILYTYLTMKEENTWSGRVMSSLKSVGITYLGALILSSLYFVYAGIQQDGFEFDINAGVIAFSFTHVIKCMVSGDLTVNSSVDDLVYVPLLYLFMASSALILFGVVHWLNRKTGSATNVLLKVDALLLTSGIIGGGISAYLIPLRIAPFLEIEKGKYLSTDSFEGWIYHYGAKTPVGHFIAKMGYQWATIIADLPTAITILCLIGSVLLLVRIHDEYELPLSLLLSSALGILVLYSIAGLPVDAKYYSYSIFVIGMCAIYVTCKYDMFEKKYLIGCYYLLCSIEMILFIPNIKPFSPIWLWHRHEHNIEVRRGQWYAGEVYFWGEQNAIAGNIIEKLVKPSTKKEDVTIYSNYFTVWPGNPGYNLVRLQSQEENKLRFDKNAYYVISKFTLFRSDTPRYLYEVKPLATIDYKGEVGAWIYRGDQLKGYADELVDQKAN